MGKRCSLRLATLFYITISSCSLQLPSLFCITISRPLDQGLQLQSQVYSVIAGLVWAGDIPMDYDDHIDNTRLRLIFKVDMYEFRGSAYEGMHSSSLVYLNLFDGGHSCE
nr:hypothetical protein CFP56_05925 [Quercus suber]